MSETKATKQIQYVIELRGSQIRVSDIHTALGQAPNGWVLTDIGWWGSGNGNLRLTFVDAVQDL